MTKTLAGLAVVALLIGGVVIVRHARLQAQQQDPGGMSDPADVSDMHLHMGSHMKMTVKRPAAPGDTQRAAEIVNTLRGSLEKYKDYRAALADGYRIFLPNIPQPQYHFTNYWRGLEATWTFDPAKPTSLLYKKTADGYQLLGAMYTAPRRMSEDKLNARVPLSVAQWHAHVNICLPPAGQKGTADLTKFSFAGSIATADECHQAGGRFEPQIFGWMVHVYPFETAPENVWRH